jgi:hypothetical protein
MKSDSPCCCPWRTPASNDIHQSTTRDQLPSALHRNFSTQMAHSIHQKITTIINEHAHVPAVLPAASLFLFGVVWLLFLPLASPRNGRGKKCRYPGDKLDQTGSLFLNVSSRQGPRVRGDAAVQLKFRGPTRKSIRVLRYSREPHT